MSEYRAVFNGYNVTLFKDNVSVKSWDAVSGKEGYQSPRNTSNPSTGALPEGNWTIDTSAIQFITKFHDVVGSYVAPPVYDYTNFKLGRWPGGVRSWGLERVDLVPEVGTETFGRTKFTIHGGDIYGSAGCIDLGHSEVDFFKTITSAGIGKLSVEVKYDERLLTEKHPLAGKVIDDGINRRDPGTIDHLGRPVGLDWCFLAGTPIAMHDGTVKYIEEINVGDLVMSFNQKAPFLTSPKAVTRIFKNTTTEIINLRGLKCTASHAFFTDKPGMPGEYAFEPIKDILTRDGILINQSGSFVRARTGAIVGTEADIAILVNYYDHAASEHKSAKVRAGIPMFYRKATSQVEQIFNASLCDILKDFSIKITDAGKLVDEFGREFHAINWPDNSSPFDNAVTENWIVSSHIDTHYVPGWINKLNYRALKFRPKAVF